MGRTIRDWGWDHERWLCAWVSKLGHTFRSFDGAGSGKREEKFPSAFCWVLRLLFSGGGLIQRLGTGENGCRYRDDRPWLMTMAKRMMQVLACC